MRATNAAPLTNQDYTVLVQETQDSAAVLCILWHMNAAVRYSEFKFLGHLVQHAAQTTGHCHSITSDNTQYCAMTQCLQIMIVCNGRFASGPGS
jgi:hypothetical protein